MVADRGRWGALCVAGDAVSAVLYALPVAALLGALYLWLRPLRRSELESAAAFWRRAAMRAAWRGDDATESYAERQYRACEERLRVTDGPTKGAAR